VALFLLAFVTKVFSQCSAGYIGVPPYCTDQWAANSISLPDPDSDQYITHYALSDDGTTLVFQTANNIYVYNISSTSAPSLSNSFLSVSPLGAGNGVALSSDGSQAAIVPSSNELITLPSFTVSGSATSVWASDYCTSFSVASSGDGLTLATIPNTGSSSYCVEICTFSSGWACSCWSFSNCFAATGIALSNDGSTLAVGFANPLGNSFVNVYDVSGLIADPGSYSPCTISGSTYTFGDFVSVADDGSVVVVADDGNNVVYIYNYVDGSYELGSTINAPESSTSFAQGVDYASTSGSLIVGGATSDGNQFFLYDSDGDVQFSAPAATTGGLAAGSGCLPSDSSPAVSRNGQVVAVQDPSNNYMWVYQYTG